MALDWQLATVTSVRDETPTVRTFTLGLTGWDGHRPGQHVDLRLTAEDGYSVERSYSIASEPERGSEIDITVERIPGGEVSPFLHDIVVPGDRLELRGPIGGYFVWEAALAGPLLLVAGGSGVVPLMAMARHRARAAAASSAGSGVPGVPGVARLPGQPGANGATVSSGPSPARLLFSSRGADEIIYRGELESLAAMGDGFEVVHTLTRQQPPGWTGYARRIDEAMLAEVLEPLGSSARAYACGPTALVETVANGLLRLGLPPDRIRTERFGPTGT